MKRYFLLAFIVALFVTGAVTVQVEFSESFAMTQKDTRYEIEREIRTVATRSLVTLELVEACNAILCDLGADEMIEIAIESVADHAREADRLLRVYR